MFVTPWERREAEEFHDSLADASKSDAQEHVLARRLAHTGNQLTHATQMDTSARDRIRSRLVAVASVQAVNGVPDSSSERVSSRDDTAPRRWGPISIPQRTAIIAGICALILTVSGVGVASNSAVPGDTLYSLKRSREAAQLALAGSDTSRGTLHLRFARTRLHEAQEVRDIPPALRHALNDMDSDTRAAMRELGGVAVAERSHDTLGVVRNFLQQQRPEVVSLRAQLSDSSRERAQSSLVLLDQVQNRVERLTSSLQCSGSTTPHGSDELGPLPLRCSAAPTVYSGSTPQKAPSAPAAGEDASGESASPSAEGDGAQPSSSGSSGLLPEGEDVLPSAQSTPNGTEKKSDDNGVLGDAVEGVGDVLGGLLGALTGS